VLKRTAECRLVLLSAFTRGDTVAAAAAAVVAVVHCENAAFRSVVVPLFGPFLQPALRASRRPHLPDCRPIASPSASFAPIARGRKLDCNSRASSSAKLSPGKTAATKENLLLSVREGFNRSLSVGRKERLRRPLSAPFAAASCLPRRPKVAHLASSQSVPYSSLSLPFCPLPSSAHGSSTVRVDRARARAR